MTAVVRWRFFLRVKNREKALRLVEREILPRLGSDCRFVSDEKYWKIPELWECVIEQRLDWRSDAEVAFDVLVTADRLGTGWYVCGPSDEGPWHFDGVLASKANGRPKVTGLDWAHFDVASEASPESAGAEAAVKPPRP